jgi:magnesium transporter
MINAFVCTDGRLRRVTATDTTDTVEALRSAVWLDLVSAEPREIGAVHQATGLRVPTEADVSEIENSSRLAVRDGVLYLSIQLISTRNGGARGVSAGLVLSPERLITVRFAPSTIFDHFSNQATTGEIRLPTPAHILVGLLEMIVDRKADALEVARNDLDALSHKIFSLGTGRGGGRKQEDATLRQTLGQLGRLGDMISQVRDTQTAAARIVPYVAVMAKAWLPKDLPPRLKTLRQDIASIRDFETSLTNKLQFLLDATLGFINIAQNNVMKVMAVASVVGIPPVLIAGVYGMNFKIMPELAWRFGYLWGWALIIATALVPLAAFRWKKWI